jgi:hypothetical protein
MVAGRQLFSTVSEVYMEEMSAGASCGVAGEGQASAIPSPAAPPAPPSHFTFSTDDGAPEGRFETWRDVWLKTIEVEISVPAPETFDLRQRCVPKQSRHRYRSNIDAKTGVDGNQKFAFIGTDGFSGEKGELRYKDLGAEVIVQGDVNGDGKADFEILVKAGKLDAGDFLL